MPGYNRDFGSSKARGDKRFDGRGSGRQGFNKERGGERHMMHQTVCDECGSRCEVPFRPSGDKPVFCNDCFRRDDDGGRDRGDRGGFSRRDERGGRQDHGGDRGGFKKDFGRKPDRDGGAPERKGIDKAQLESLNYKMDKIISLLEASLPAKEKIAPIMVDKNDQVKKTEKKEKAEKIETPVEKTEKAPKAKAKKAKKE